MTLYKCDICGEITRDPTMDCLVIGNLEKIKQLGESKTGLSAKGIYLDDHICQSCKQTIVNMLNKKKEKNNG